MQDKFVSYVNSTMNELNELTSDLYEAMIDKQRSDILATIKSIRKCITDIQKSYEEQFN
jgi:hypothetical protein